MYPQIPSIDTVVPKRMQIKPAINAILFRFMVPFVY
jgi:hypothetical protein